MCTRKGHLEAIEQIRQMMADEKYFEAQKIIEVQLKINSVDRYSLLKLYFESLTNQNKFIPEELQIELAERSLENKEKKIATNLLQTKFSEKYFSRLSKLRLKNSVENGNFDETYKVLSEFILKQFESQRPVLPEWIDVYIKNYFRNDFAINLKLLSINLLRNDLNSSEEIIKKLIISTCEMSSNRSCIEKIKMIGQVLSGASNKGRLEVYQNLCFIYSEGIKEKSDYKKLIEMIIFFDEFKFQVLVLNLLFKLGLEDQVKEFTVTVRLNKSYSFVYLDKYYPKLKNFFHSAKTDQRKNENKILAPDLLITEKIKSEILSPVEELELVNEEVQYNNILKYQNFDNNQLCELSVSFIQSQMPRIALTASELAVNVSKNDKEFLKASYLKFTSLMLVSDFRAAIDTCIFALEKAETKDDVLSFLYGKAEAYIRLNLTKEAKKVLRNILEIDSNYRLAKERLEKLNEI